jgi:hypothetical protein
MLNRGLRLNILLHFEEIGPFFKKEYFSFRHHQVNKMEFLRPDVQSQLIQV